MKKHLSEMLRLMILWLFVGWPVWLSAQKSVWTESFEGGVLPSGWTEERTSGSLNWQFEEGTAVNNDLAYDGVKRARLIGQGTTRLILPMTDIKTGLTMPYLRFAYKLKMIDSRIDTLRVLYRTEVTGEWRPLQGAEYAVQKTDWTYEELSLAEISTAKDVQIAFEGKAVFGGGILLDFVSIGDQYNCAAPPTDLAARDLTPNTATLRWFGNNNDMGRKYYLVIDTVSHTTDLDMAEVWKRDTVLATGDEHYDLTGLEANRDYFFYVKSDCDYNDLSDWSDECAFHTPCLPQTLPLVELFEDGDSYDCWLFNKGEATTPYVSSSSTGAASQGKSYLYFYASSGKGMSYAALPASDADVRTLMLSFMGYSGYNGTIEIGVLEDPYDPSTYQTVKIFNTKNDKTYRRYCVAFDNYTGSGKYIAIVNQAGLATNGFCIDSVRLEEKPACPPLFLQEVGAITATSALFTWSSIGDETSWTVRLFNTAQTDPETATPLKEYNVTGNMEQILSDLTPDTEYYVYVKPTCGSIWVEDNFTTGTAITVPFTENFDFYGAATAYREEYLPTGWVVGNLKSTSTSYRPFTYGKEEYSANYSYDHTDNPNNPYHACLNFKGSSSYYQPYAIMPQILGDDDINGLMLQFYALSTVGDLLTVGVMEDPADMETFEPIRTISMADEWNLETVYFDKYKGSGRYIVFVLHLDAKPNATPSARIDDLSLTVASDCHIPLDVEALNISAKSVDLKWNSYTETHWKLQIATDETMTTLIKDMVVDDDSCHINDLTPWTEYYVRVAADCGNGEVSEWSHLIHFKTYAEISSLPYENRFDDIKGTTSSSSNTVADFLVPQWHVWNISGASSFVYTPHIYGDTSYKEARDHRVNNEVKDNYNCVKMSSTKSYNGSCMVSPEITAVENVNSLQLSFWGYASSADYTVTVGVAEDPTDTSTYVPVETFTLVEDEWTYCVAFMSDYIGTGKYIYLLSCNPSKTNLVYVDDVVIQEIPDCPEVTNIALKEGTLTDVSATFVWDANNAEKWNMKIFDRELIGEEIDTQAAVVSLAGITGTEKLVEGLSGNHVYYVYMQSVNDAKACVGNWSVPFVFRTECSVAGESLPFYANFEGEGSGVQPSCWVADNFGSTSSSLIPKTDAHSTSSTATDPVHDDSEYSLYFSSSSTGGVYTWAATPMLNITDIRQVQLTFIGADDEPSILQVGICDQPNNLQNFVLVKECQIKELKTWNHFTVLFNSVSEVYSGYKYIVFKCLNTGPSGEYSSATDHYFYLDDVLVEELPACVQAFDVQASEVKQTSALINWTGNDETQWDICVLDTLVSPESVDTYQEDAVAYVGDNTVKPYRLENLPAGTELYVYVRTKNAAKDCVGQWSMPAKLFTQCAAIGVPYYEDFENYRTVSSSTACSNLKPEEFPKCLVCSGNTTTAPSLYGLGCGNFDCFEKGTTALYMTTADGKTNYVSFPEVDVDNVNVLEVAFQVCKTYNNVKSGIIRIGVMDDPYDPTTFTKVWEDTLQNYLSQKEEWSLYVVSLADYVGYGKYITISMPGLGTTNHAYFDWVRIDSIQSIHAPLSTTVESVLEDSVVATWDVIDGEKWRVRIVPYHENVSVDNPAVVDTVVVSPYATLGSLAYDTHYMLYVAGIQGNDTSEWGKGVKFRSACPPSYTLPYFEDFQAYDIKEYCCWTSLNTNTKSDTIASVNVHSDTGMRGLNFPKGCRMMLPSFKGITSVENLRLTFTALPTTNAYNITVWAYDGSNYTSVGTAEIQSSTYDKRPIDFSFSFKDIAQCQYIALGVNNSGYITNVLVEEDVCPRPINVRLTNRMDTAVTVTWDGVGSVDSWEVEYGLAGFTAGEGTSVKTSTDSIVIAPLTPETAYDIYVRSVSDESGVYSEWVKAGTLVTMPTVATAPYFCDFEDTEECSRWQQVKYEASDRNPNDWYIGTFPGNESGRVAYISNDGGDTFAFSSLNGGTQDLYRNIYLKAGKYKIAFDWQNVGDIPDYYAKLTAVLYTPGCVPNLSNANYWKQENGVNATSALDASYTLTVKGRKSDTQGTGQETWRRDSTILDVPKDGVYSLVFSFRCGANRNGEEHTPAAIDNIAVDLIPCAAPANVVVKNISDTAFTLTWNPSLLEEMNEWQVKVFNTGVRYDSLSTQKAYIDTVVTKPTVTFDTLQANTMYYYAIRMMCGEDTWTPVANVTTLCAPVALPMVETFESYTSGANGTRPDCWLYSAPLEYGGIYVNSSGKEGKGLYLSTDKYIVLPLFDEDINNIELRFDFACAAASKLLYVGLMSDPFDIGTFDEVTSVYSERGSTGNWYECETNFFNYQGDGRYIAIKASSTFYLDSIQVRKMPDCGRVMQIEATETTRDAVTLDWLSAGETSWNVKLATTELANMWQTDGVVVDTLVYEHPITLSGLDSWTEYYVYVQAVCDDGESDWSKPYVFHTACGTYELPFVEDFSRYDDLNSSLDRWEVEAAGCWTMRYGELDAVLAGSAHPTTLPITNEKYPDTQNSRWALQVWQGLNNPDSVKVTTTALNGQIYYSPAGSSTSGGYESWSERKAADWFVSPEIAVTGENVRLVFDLSIGNKDGIRSDDRFALLVSEDAGETWKRENATIWSGDASGDLRMQDIREVLSPVSFDMSRYVGKTIKFAFYIERLSGGSNTSLSEPIIHVDNVSLRCFYEYTWEDVICQNNDYDRNGFFLSYDKVVNDTVLTRESLTGECDSLITLHLHVTKPQTTPLEAEICQNEAYTGYNFNLPIQTEAGMFEHRQYLREAGGCDSIVILNLTVHPAYKDTDVVIIKDIELPFVYNDTTFDVGSQSGFYNLLYATEYGCDSIVTVDLTVEVSDNLSQTSVGNISFTPNPVKGNATVYVDCRLKDPTMYVTKIELFSSVGALIDKWKGDNQKISFAAPREAGVYIVRITTNTKDIVIGKLIVE